MERWHYSGKTAPNSQIHLGVFMGGSLLGAMQFGPSLDKSKVIGLVQGTPWNGFLELNRMAFSDKLPRNSESRAIAVAMRMIKKKATHVQWVISFADGAQCGDGTIYRASGFVLTSIRRNGTIYKMPNGDRFTDIGIKTGSRTQVRILGRVFGGGQSALVAAKEAGAVKLPGFQLRYIFPIDPTVMGRLTVPVVPFAAIKEHGANMYRGKPSACEAS